MKDNIPGFIGYHVSKTGNVYSRYVRGSRGKLRFRGFKERKIVRKAIREYENNKSV